MPSNVLTGKVEIVAPGVAQTFATIQQGVQKTEAAIIKLNPGVSALGKTLDALKARRQDVKGFIDASSDIAEVGILNKELKSLEAEIVRVEAAGSGGGGFSAVGKGATQALSAVRQFAYILPGIGVAGIIGGLAEMVAGLFSSEDAFTKTDLAAGHFENTLRDLKKEVEDFKDALDFQNKLEKIGNELSGLTGGKLFSANSSADLKENALLVGDLTTKIDQQTTANKKSLDARNDAERTIVSFGKEITNFGKAMIEFGKVEDIPSRVFKKLSKDDQDFITDYKKNSEEIESLKKSRTEAIQSTLVAVGGILKGGIDSQKELSEEEKKINEKAARDFEKYSNDIISRAKKISEAFKNGIDLKLNLSALDSKSDIFKKSLSFLNKFDAGQFQFTITPKFNFADSAIPPAEVKPVATQFGQMFYNDVNAYFKTAAPIDFSLLKAPKEFLIMQDKLKGLASVIENTLTPVFQDFFDTVANGGNAFKAFANAAGQALIGLIEKLAIAAILSLILSSITGAGTAIGAASGKFADIFKFLSGFGGARAGGGPVSGGKTYLVGENGPEWFTAPNTGGRIVPNNQLGNMGGGLSGGMRFQIVGTNVIQGRDLVQIFTLQKMSDNRLI